METILLKTARFTSCDNLIITINFIEFEGYMLHSLNTITHLSLYHIFDMPLHYIIRFFQVYHTSLNSFSRFVGNEPPLQDWIFHLEGKHKPSLLVPSFPR